MRKPFSESGSQKMQKAGGKTIRTVCSPHCMMRCGILVHVKDSKIVKIEPADFPDQRYKRICLKGLTHIQYVYHPDRLRYPMKRVGERGEGKWQRISWDEALDTIATKFEEIKEKYGSTAIAWFRGMGSYGLLSDAPRRLASLFGGTIILGGIDSAGPQALQDTLGCGWFLTKGAEYSFGGGNEIMDCVNSKLIIIWGANYAETAPFWMRFILDAMEKGTKLFVIDPRLSTTAAKADEWIPIRPGTDSALALGMMNVIISEGLCDKDFLTRHTVGPFLVRTDNRCFLRQNDIGGGNSRKYLVWDIAANEAQPYDTNGITPALTGTYEPQGIECKPAFQLLASLTAGYTLERVEEITEIPVETIRELAIEYATVKPASIGLYFGLDRWYYGDLAYRAIFTLAAITGQIGVSGGGFYLPPCPYMDLNVNPWYFPAETTHKTLNPLEMYDTIITNKPYPIKALYIWRGNFLRNANQNKIINQLFPRLGLIVVADHFITPTAEYADIVLPVCTLFETTDVLTQPFPYIQLQPKVIEPMYQCKSDLEIAAEFAKRLGFEKYFDKSPEQYIELLLEKTGVTLERLKEQGAVPIKTQTRPYVPFSDKKFYTPSGKIEFYVERSIDFGQELPVYIEPEEGTYTHHLAKKYPLILQTSHCRFHVHSTFANMPSLLEINPEPVLEINQADAEKRGILDGDMVICFNDRGSVKLKARMNEGMRPGTVDIRHGWWPKQFAEGTYQCLTHEKINPALRSPNFSFSDCLIEVKKA